MSKSDRSSRDFIQVIGRGLLYFGIVISVIPKGSVSYFYIFFSSAIFSIILLLPAISKRVMLKNTDLVKRAFSVIIFIVLYAFFQTASFDWNVFANANWGYASELLKSDNNSISVSPSQTRWAIIQTVSPFIVFISVLILSNSEKDALRIWEKIVYIGIIISLFSILNLYFWPLYILFEERVHDTESLTGFFVNRNTAATYLGVCTVATVSLLIFNIRDLRDYVRKWFGRKISTKMFKDKYLFLLLGLFIEFIALQLTSSRGGILASYIAILFLIFFTLYYRTSGFKLFVFLMSSVVALGVLFLVYGQNVLARFLITSLGSEEFRFCVYLSTIDAIKENWIFGTGLGTFFEIFPAYRREACGIYNQWAYAHNFYLEGYLSLGVVFALIGAYVYWVVIRTLISGVQNRVRYRAFPVGGLAIVLLVSIHSSVDFSLQIHAVAVLVAAVLGVATAISFRSEGHKPSISGVDVLSKH